uniref:Uncharacterized protein n=1 Tax=Gracilariopsis mclachlanii TaxID=486813 RepID=A0A345UAC8_9FLOR|nr:hypothetical protein [Gracilariopsis mclachlanii]AXI97414.1 hypothetical protein [Gracilariopsis mclachlanii]
MYFYRQSNTNYMQYYIGNLRFNSVLIFCIFSYLIIDAYYIYFDYIYNYKAFVETNVFSKYFLHMIMFLIIDLTAILELNVINLKALSLYYWLGFNLINKRSFYYSYNNVDSSAYLLINVKTKSKNILRRHLIVNIDNGFFN